MHRPEGIARFAFSTNLRCILFPSHPDSILQSLLESLSILSVELIPIHEKLVNIRRKLVALAAKQGPHKAELKPLQEELRKIDSLSTRLLTSCMHVPLMCLPWRLFLSPFPIL